MVSLRRPLSVRHIKITSFEFTTRVFSLFYTCSLLIRFHGKMVMEDLKEEIMAEDVRVDSNLNLREIAMDGRVTIIDENK